MTGRIPSAHIANAPVLHQLFEAVANSLRHTLLADSFWQIDAFSTFLSADKVQACVWRQLEDAKHSNDSASLAHMSLADILLVHLLCAIGAAMLLTNEHHYLT